MWIEAQREFIVALKEYKRIYENILEQEKRLDQAKKQLVSKWTDCMCVCGGGGLVGGDKECVHVCNISVPLKFGT